MVIRIITNAKTGDELVRAKEVSDLFLSIGALSLGSGVSNSFIQAYCVSCFGFAYYKMEDLSVFCMCEDVKRLLGSLLFQKNKWSSKCQYATWKQYMVWESYFSGFLLN